MTPDPGVKNWQQRRNEAESKQEGKQLRRRGRILKGRRGRGDFETIISWCWGSGTPGQKGARGIRGEVSLFCFSSNLASRVHCFVMLLSPVVGSGVLGHGLSLHPSSCTQEMQRDGKRCVWNPAGGVCPPSWKHLFHGGTLHSSDRQALNPSSDCTSFNSFNCENSMLSDAPFSCALLQWHVYSGHDNRSLELKILKKLLWSLSPLHVWLGERHCH